MMKKIITFILLLILCIILSISLCIYIGFQKEKNCFEMDVSKYLSQKYNEEMIIKDIGFYDGFYAEVFPENHDKLVYEVSYSRKADDYCDSYLVKYLEYDLSLQIADIINDDSSRIIVDSGNYGPQFREMLETKYNENHKPATWKDLNMIPDVQWIEIYFDRTLTTSELESLEERLSLFECKFTSILVYEHGQKIYEIS